MKAHVGMVTQWYDPERGSAALPGIISRSLARRGHDVEVVTGFPNYPNGSLYPGYRLRPYLREQIAGITVHRAPLYPSHDTNPRRRAGNFLSFAAAASVIATSRLRNADVLLVHSTPATVALPAMAVRAVRRTPYVVHIQDLWPQTVVASGFLQDGHAGTIEKALHRLCDSVYRQAHSVAVTSPGMARLIAERGIAEDKIHFVPNWVDEDVFQPTQRDNALAESLGISGPFTVMYAGNLGEFQALEVLVEAADRLRDRSEISFVFVGGGVEELRLRGMVEDRGLLNVRFVDTQPYAQMASILALGDVQIVSLRDMPLFRTTLPSKLQATLAAGRPTIAAVTGDAADVVRRSGAGLVVPPGSVDALVRAILDLHSLKPGDLRSLGISGREHYMNHFSESVAGDTLSKLLQSAASPLRRAER